VVSQLVAGGAVVAVPHAAHELGLATRPESVSADDGLELRNARITNERETAASLSIFSAVENGFFKEEGLDVTLIKSDWKTYKDSLALGGYDITQHLVMYFLKPIEQGLDVKFLGGIHTGCLRVQAAAKSEIHSVADLRGKRP